jgi:hypothetical protein
MLAMHGRPGGHAQGVAGPFRKEYLLLQLKPLKRRIVNFLVFLGLVRLGTAAQTRFYERDYPISDAPVQHPPARRHR